MVDSAAPEAGVSAPWTAPDWAITLTAQPIAIAPEIEVARVSMQIKRTSAFMEAPVPVRFGSLLSPQSRGQVGDVIESRDSDVRRCASGQ
jgi:hypothetical protein